LHLAKLVLLKKNCRTWPDVIEWFGYELEFRLPTNASRAGEPFGPRQLHREALSFTHATINSLQLSRGQKSVRTLALRVMSSSAGAKINQKIESLPPVVADKLPHVPESTAQLKEDAKEAGKKSLAGLRSLAAGGFGGVCAVIVGHPFDLVKVRLQTAERGVYTSALDVVRKSIARDGVRRGLYAGVSAPLVGVTPMCMFQFSLLRALVDIGQLRYHSGDMMLERASSGDSRQSTTINSPSHNLLQLDSSLRFP
jgi:hypothetical protein